MIFGSHVIIDKGGDLLDKGWFIGVADIGSHVINEGERLT